MITHTKSLIKNIWPTHGMQVKKIMTEMVGVGTEICTHLRPDMYSLTAFGEWLMLFQSNISSV